MASRVRRVVEVEDIRKSQGCWDSKNGQVDNRAVYASISSVQSSRHRQFIAWEYILRANAPVNPKPKRRRENPTRNWEPFPTVGRNGLPDAACQTSSNAESMCFSWLSAENPFNKSEKRPSMSFLGVNQEMRMNAGELEDEVLEIEP